MCDYLMYSLFHLSDPSCHWLFLHVTSCFSWWLVLPLLIILMSGCLALPSQLPLIVFITLDLVSCAFWVACVCACVFSVLLMCCGLPAPERSLPPVLSVTLWTTYTVLHIILACNAIVCSYSLPDFILCGRDKKLQNILDMQMTLNLLCK